MLSLRSLSNCFVFASLSNQFYEYATCLRKCLYVKMQPSTFHFTCWANYSVSYLFLFYWNYTPSIVLFKHINKFNCSIFIQFVVFRSNLEDSCVQISKFKKKPFLNGKVLKLKFYNLITLIIYMFCQISE